MLDKLAKFITITLRLSSIYKMLRPSSIEKNIEISFHLPKKLRPSSMYKSIEIPMYIENIAGPTPSSLFSQYGLVCVYWWGDMCCCLSIYFNGFRGEGQSKYCSRFFNLHII